MGSFNQMTQNLDVKKEVSDVGYELGEHSDFESLPAGSSDNYESDNSNKRMSDAEQDSPSNDASGSPLPPRKRAKTQEEKEQRRIERIMRNRQAAHASREKKRKHLEALEARCAVLETENLHLRNSLNDFDQICSRLQQLESAVKTAKASGDISVFDSFSALGAGNSQIEPPMQPQMIETNIESHMESNMVGPISTTPNCGPTGNNNIEGTIEGTVVGAISQPLSTQSLGFLSETASLTTSGSPAPSLEEDCSSPESLLKIKTEEEIYHPYSPESMSAIDFSSDDPFGMMNIAFGNDQTSTSDSLVFTDSSSKSRHPAALTQPLLDTPRLL